VLESSQTGIKIYKHSEVYEDNEESSKKKKTAPKPIKLILMKISRFKKIIK